MRFAQVAIRGYPILRVLADEPGPSIWISRHGLAACIHHGFKKGPTTTHLPEKDVLNNLAYLLLFERDRKIHIVGGTDHLDYVIDSAKMNDTEIVWHDPDYDRGTDVYCKGYWLPRNWCLVPIDKTGN